MSSFAVVCFVVAVALPWFVYWTDCRDEERREQARWDVRHGTKGVR